MGKARLTSRYEMGVSVSATGPAAFLGDPEAKTIEMLVEQLNEEGGINGEEIALTLYDDGGDPNKARTFATRLIDRLNMRFNPGFDVFGGARLVSTEAPESFDEFGEDEKRKRMSSFMDNVRNRLSMTFTTKAIESLKVQSAPPEISGGRDMHV